MGLLNFIKCLVSVTMDISLDFLIKIRPLSFAMHHLKYFIMYIQVGQVCKTVSFMCFFILDACCLLRVM